MADVNVRCGFRALVVVFAIVSGALLILWATASSFAPKPTRCFDRERPLVIAHQGGDGLRPGNTLTAFAHAVSLGVDVLEMDAHQTRDGVVVLMHDATVDRTTDGRGALVEMDFAQVLQLDAAYHWPFDESAPFRGQGIRVPALEEVLTQFAGQRFNIEIKQVQPSMGSALCSLLREHNVLGQVLVASFHRQAMQDFRGACPEVATSGHRYEVARFVALEAIGLTGLIGLEAVALQLPLQQYGIELTSADRLDAAQLLGLHVDAWTLNDAKTIESAFLRGVNGVISDRPDVALTVRQRLNRSADH